MGQPHHLIPDSSSNESWFSNSDIFLKQKHKPNSFFTVPGLFVGPNHKTSESDLVRSPTSPFDFKVFSKPNLGNSPLTSNEGRQKSWDSNKVGLSIVESLEDKTNPSSGKILRSSDSKTVLFAPQTKILTNPSLKNARFDHSKSTSNSLPENYAMFPHTHPKKFNPQMINPLEQDSCAKFSSHSLDSAKPGLDLISLSNGPSPGIDLVGSLSASEIELSEDYTCVRKHGPNPKTTHIFGDRILDRHNDMFFMKSVKYEEQVIVVPASYPSDDFLSFCYTCKKKLEGEDIYIYRGEKAFCSLDCRSREILIEESMEKMNNKDDSSSGTKPKPKLNKCEEVFETSMFIAT